MNVKEHTEKSMKITRHACVRKSLLGDVLFVIVELGHSYRQQRYMKFKVFVLMCCLVCCSPVAHLTSEGPDLWGSFHIYHSLSAVPCFATFAVAESDILLLVVAALPSDSEEGWLVIEYGKA